MKKHFIKVAVIAALFFANAQALFAAEEKADPISLTLQADAAYYPLSARITGGDHFAPITGPYSGLEGAVTLNGQYKIATPLGENWLLSGANVGLGAAIEVTPISFKPKLSVDFTPLPFLIFKAGTSVGFGWNIGSIEGLCLLNKGNSNYEPLSTFAHPYYDLWASATFQFDTGAIIPGDWTHVVILATYKTTYSGLMGLDKDAIYEWQCSKNKAQGLEYEVQGILGYQMPTMLRLAGVMVKSQGHYNGADYGTYDKNYDGSFATVNISPVMQFKFTDKDELYCLFDFSSRRSFGTSYERDGQSLRLTKTGREWYFQRFALSWSHKLR